MMTSEPEFLPPVPRRMRPDAGLELLKSCGSIDAFAAELESRGGLIIEDRPSSGTSVVTVARRARAEDERIALLLATITHMHRSDLEPFLLDRVDAFGAVVHMGAFELPRELRTEIGFLARAPWDPGVGRSRDRWRSALARSEAPSRRRPVFRSPTGGEANLLSLPGAAAQSLTDDVGSRREELTEERWDSEYLGMPVRSWVWQSPAVHGPPRATALMTDGDRYTGEYTLVPALRRGVREGVLPPMSAVFFAPADPSDRPRMLGANPGLPGFIDKELLVRAARHTDVAPQPHMRAMAGASLGGLATADVVRRAPHVVGRGIIQSASFWWPDEGSPSEQLRLWDEDPLPVQHISIYHEVGTLEGHLRAENRLFAEILRRRGVDHTAREYVGGHDYVCWRGGIIDGLIRFFGR